MTELKEYRSVTIARICMKLVGFWHVKTAKEQLFLRIVFTYAVWAISFAILVLGVDLYHCILSGDFYVSDAATAFARLCLRKGLLPRVSTCLSMPS